MRRPYALLSLTLLATLIASSGATPATTQALAIDTAGSFVTHEVASGLDGGYQVIAVDMNHDGKLDLVAVASGLRELLWFENPTWARHVVAGGFTELINVAAADLDGDGYPELAVASSFSTKPMESAGIVSLLTHPADPTHPWSTREIDRTPAAHRLRWYVDAAGQRWLINAPLAGATLAPPNYGGATPLWAYRPPDWKREPLPSAEVGVVHAIEPIRGGVCDTCLLTAGFGGIHRYEQGRSGWTTSLVAGGDASAVPRGGSSEVAVGRAPAAGTEADRVFIAAIEPWHGNQVVVYRRATAGTLTRRVIDTSVVDGHTLVAADLDGDGTDEIIVGQREGRKGVWICSFDVGGNAWRRSTLDEGGMAAAGCVAADLNGDGRIDIACIGTATANLKWYENRR